MASRTVDTSNAPRNTPSAGGNRLFSAQTPDVREGLPYVEYRADARSPKGGGSGAGGSSVPDFSYPSPLGGAPSPGEEQERKEPEQKKPKQSAGTGGQNSSGPGGQAPGAVVAQNSGGQGQGNGWNYQATVVAPGPAYGGAAWTNGGPLADAISGTTRPAIGAGPKVIKGAIEAVEDL